MRCFASCCGWLRDCHARSDASASEEYLRFWGLQQDRELASQLQRAATSVCLNVGEGRCRSGGDRRRCYEIAEGSASEVEAALDVAEAWGWRVEVGASRKVLDRLRGLLWGLTHGRRIGPGR